MIVIVNDLNSMICPMIGYEINNNNNKRIKEEKKKKKRVIQRIVYLVFTILFLFTRSSSHVFDC